MSTKVSRTVLASKLFEIGLAIKLNKVPLETIESKISIENIDNIISTIEDMEIDNWDGSHITPGENLKAALEMHDISQAEFARRLKVPAQKVNDLIHNRLNITVEWAKKIGKALNSDYKVFL